MSLSPSVLVFLCVLVFGFVQLHPELVHAQTTPSPTVPVNTNTPPPTTETTTAATTTTAPATLPLPNCNDGILNGQETGIDCGGPDCPACSNGESCQLPRDCRSQICVNGICVAFTTTLAPTTSTPPLPSATGYINVTITDLNPSAFLPICSDGVWGLYGITLNVWLSLALFGRQTYSTVPLTSLLTNAQGQSISFKVAFYFNGTTVPFYTRQIFNVANSSVDGNVWSFNLENWESAIGGNFFFFNVAPCTWQSQAPSITVAFGSDGQFVVGSGSPFGNIPAVSAFPNVINHIEPNFIHNP